jgi:hypothetical protein
MYHTINICIIVIIIFNNNNVIDLCIFKLNIIMINMLNIIKSKLKLKNTYKKRLLNNNVTIRNKDFLPTVRD